MTIAQHLRPYQPIADFRERLQLATKAVEAIYQLQGPLDLKIELRKRIFWTTAWMLTEGAGKYGARYRSKNTLIEAAENVRHEHVFPITHLYYLSRHGLSVGEALGLACACLVTKDEHNRLSSRDKRADPPLGWKRYEEAGIDVIDMQDNRPLTSEQMEKQTLPFALAVQHARFCGDGEVDVELERKEREGEDDGLPDCTP